MYGGRLVFDGTGRCCVHWLHAVVAARNAKATIVTAGFMPRSVVLTGAATVPAIDAVEPLAAARARDAFGGWRVAGVSVSALILRSARLLPRRCDSGPYLIFGYFLRLS